jgi:hypothetical protein
MALSTVARFDQSAIDALGRSSELVFMPADLEVLITTAWYVVSVQK